MTVRLAAAGVAAAVAAGLWGAWQHESAVVVVVGSLLLGMAGALALVGSTRRRVAAAVRTVRDLPNARTAERPPADAVWAPLWSALDRADERLQGQVAALARERGRMEGILEGLPPTILLFDRQGLTFANRAARGLLRLTAEDTAAGVTPIGVLGSAELADAVTRTLASGRGEELEASLSDHVLVGRTSRITDDEVALVLTDITAARRLDAVRRDFVTNASHELKTPVAGIQALAESLSLAIERDPTRSRRMVQRMGVESRRLATLVRELLDLARLEEPTVDRAASRVDLVEVVRQQVARTLTAARARDVTVTTELADVAWVVGAVEDLRLIVDNLLSNAVRYNRTGGTVTARVQTRGSTVTLEVADTGIGISEGDRERVFERFYRVDTARSRAAGGTGLGLSLVRHATVRLSGELHMTSVLGEGSTFRVVLPAADHEPAGAQVRAAGAATDDRDAP